MARNKFPEITVSRILDSSLKLFLEKGYEKTTIQDIVDELGDLSKGAIYHHFKSKEDIIDAVTNRMYYEGESFEKIKKEVGLTGLEKIKKVFAASINNMQHGEITKAISSVMDNPKFFTKQVKETVYETAPMLAELIEEGNQDGSVQVEYPKETAEIILLVINFWCNPILFHLNKDEFLHKLIIVKNILDGLGVPVFDDNMLNLMKSFFQKYMDIIRESKKAE